MHSNSNKAKPFLKWAGGKTQLLKEIGKSIPNNLTKSTFTYIEPFVGSGAVLFWILQKYPKIEYAVINDVNIDLINTYKVIKEQPQDLIEILRFFEEEYHYLDKDTEAKKVYYYEKRTAYNTRTASKTRQAAYFIFLNKTCFNGLYRVNKKNGFNVPMGRYVKPTICDIPNILNVNRLLQKVQILTGDFEIVPTNQSDPTFYYFDPPYKPLTETASFTAYAKTGFTDKDQIRLARFCQDIHNNGNYWMLSNSNPLSPDGTLSFFQTIYKDFNIREVQAKRSINSNGQKRGKLSELLITNYQYDKVIQTSLF
ncbi:MAG: DNA adenine methylase [Bacteroidota bacterium]